MELSQRFSFGVALTLGARILMAGNSVLSGIIIARLLGAESLGVFVVLSVTVSTVIQVGTFGLHIANTYFTARERENLVPAALNGTVFAIISGLICALVVWLFAPSFLPGVPRELAAIGLLSVPFQLVTIIITNLFLAQGEVKRFNYLDFLNQSFVLINAVIALVILNSGLWTLVPLNTAANAAVAILTGVLFYRFLRSRTEKINWRFDSGLLRRTLRFGIKGHILWVATFLVYRLDLLFVNYFRGSAEASVYAVATQCTLFLLLLPHAVSHILQNRVAATQDEGGEFTCRAARFTSVLLLAACILTVPGAMLLAKIYGRAFADLPFLIWLLLPGVFFVGVQAVLAQYFVGTGLPWKLPTFWVAIVVLNITLNLFAIPVYGSRGAAVVSTACYLIVFFIVFAFFKLRTGHSLREVFVLRRSDWLLFLKPKTHPASAS